jgi:V/A-type H+-transporting ATPase subunit B
MMHSLKKLLRYRADFISNIEEPFGEPVELNDALDMCWDVLRKHFEPTETGLSQKLIDEYWNK